MVKDKMIGLIPKDILSEGKAKRIKLLFLYFIYVISALSVLWYKISYATSKQTWLMVLLIALGSAFGGFMVSFVIFGGQLTNRYCSISTLDFICRWAIVLFYLLLSLLLIGYYIPGFIEESLRVLIYICFVAGILFGVQVVKKEIKKENPSVIISSIKMRKITLAAFVLLPVAAIMLNHDLISFILGFLWIALMLPASMLYLIDWYRTKGQPGRS